jgi:hypothetical protein
LNTTTTTHTHPALYPTHLHTSPQESGSILTHLINTNPRKLLIFKRLYPTIKAGTEFYVETSNDNNSFDIHIRRQA